VQANLAADGCCLRLRSRSVRNAGFLAIWSGRFYATAATADVETQSDQEGEEEVSAHTSDDGSALASSGQTNNEAQQEDAHAEELYTALNALQEGDGVTVVDASAHTHQTRPPARLSEARLVRALEHHGVGRPSTYAGIINVLLERYGHSVSLDRQSAPPASSSACLAMPMWQTSCTHARPYAHLPPCPAFSIPLLKSSYAHTPAQHPRANCAFQRARLQGLSHSD
jgi:DNA topoisomerase